MATWTDIELQQKMPVLNNIIKKYIPEQPLKGCAILSVQHSLGTMLPVISGLKALGAEELFLMGKSYSECQDVVQKMEKMPGVYYRKQEPQVALSQFIPTFQGNTRLLWQDLRQQLYNNNAIKRVLVLDHGGYAMQIIPNIDIPIVTIEKTTSGIHKSEFLPFPRIEMATSAVKRKLESPFIAQAITQKLISNSLLPELQKPGQACGVIGYGAVGSALAQHLASLGHYVIVHDSDPAKIRNLPKGLHGTKNIVPAVAYSKIIFSCTGTDITEENFDLFDLAPNDKVLVSASSDDIEFLSLLRRYQTGLRRKIDNPLQTVEIKTRNDATIKILRGGFPANFDNISEGEPPECIQLTRSLAVASAIQAAQIKNFPTKSFADSYMLDPNAQVEIARNFISFLEDHNPTYPYLQDYAKIFSQPNAVEWIIKNSGGKIPITEQTAEMIPV